MKKLLTGLIAAVTCGLGAVPAPAQQGLIDLVPRRDFTDEHGVDVTASVYRHQEALLAIGGGARRLGLNLTLTSPGPVQNPSCYLASDIGNAVYQGLDSHSYFGNTAGTALMTVVLPHQSAKFGVYGNPIHSVIPQDASYVTASFNANYSVLSYTGADGTEATLSAQHQDISSLQSMLVWGATDEVRFPDGEVWTYRYNDMTWGGGGCGGKVSRVRSIVSNRGYGIQLNYAEDSASGAIPDWISPVRATVYNKANVYCDETLLQSCASVAALNSTVTFAYDRPNNRVTITKPNGETVQLTFGQVNADAMTLTEVTRPGGVTRTMTYQANTFDEGAVYRMLGTLTEAGRTWSYGFGPSSGGGSTSVVEPGGALISYILQGETPYSILDPLLRETVVEYDGWHRFLRQRYPEGNEVTAGYDARGNLSLVRNIAKPASGLPHLQASAVFPASCTSTDRRSCNRPISTTDFNTNTTDYTYDPAHGGILTETGPLIPTRQNDGSIASVRPQKRYEYAQRYAWVSNGAGGYVQAAAPIWLLVRERVCRTTAASGSGCAGGAADEVVTDYDYGPNSGPNTLLLRGVAVTADGGAGLVTRRTCYAYDTNGNRISETQPNANLASCS